MTYKIFLDDERYPKDEKAYVIARDFDSLKEIIKHRGWPKEIAFDHDLGEFKANGYEVARWLVEQDMNTPWMKKVGFTYTVHSQNPVGARNIDMYLNQYLKERVYV